MYVLKLTLSPKLLLGVFFAAIVLSASHSSLAYADNRNPLNQAEVAAKDLCINGPYDDRRGAIWFSNSGDYYAGSVVVESDATSVGIKIRGSVYSCGQAGTADTGAVDISSSGLNSWRLSGFSSTELRRGSVTGANNWSSQGGAIDATLNVSGLAMNNTAGDDTETIQAGLYRCFYNYTSSRKGICYTQIIDITVVRKKVPYNYDLVPSVTKSATSVAQGSNVTFTHLVTKTGTVSKPTAYAIRQIVVPAGGSFNQSVGLIDDANQARCDARYGASASCVATVLDSGTLTFSGTPTTVTVPAAVATINTGSYDVGTLICRILAVNPPTHNSSPGHRWSALACVVVAKKPYLAIKNGDAWAGGSFKSATGTCPVASARGFEGSNTTFPDGTYGAYSEYGLLSLRSVTNFGSAGKPFGNKLTFRNTPAPIGYFSTTANNCLNDALDYYGGKAVSDRILNATLRPINSGIYARDRGDMTPLLLTQTDPGAIVIGSGKHMVIMVDGDITINRNIEFAPGPYTNLNDIPSLTVISRNGNISVAQNVTRLDGFYQASQRFVTCLEGAGGGGIGENDNLCNQQLTVNGAVTATEIIARRIHGGANKAGVDQRNDPAELFIMRPDLFLSQYGQAQATSQLRSVDENELPPRY